MVDAGIQRLLLLTTMRHIAFGQSDTYHVALLIKTSAFNQGDLENHYVNPLVKQGISADQMVAVDLAYNEAGKAPAGFIKSYLDELMPALASVGTKYIYVADAAYFKAIAGQSKADPHFGYALPCKLKGYEHMTVVLGLNHGALLYNPELYTKLDLSLQTLANTVNGTYKPLGQDIIHSAQYPRSLAEIEAALQSLHKYPTLSADIEAFSLDFDKAGIGTITFCWDQHNGIAFACDYHERLEESPDYPITVGTEAPAADHHGYQLANLEVRALIKQFLTDYKGRISWHKANYDLKVIIYTLWMKNGLDTQGLLEGLEVTTRVFDDTRIIGYLATNSTAGNELGLKQLAHEFAGNWAVEVSDIRTVPLAELLRYNLIDGLSTCFVRDKYGAKMIEDRQQQIYEELMLPSQKLILQMELTGMPLVPHRVKAVRAELEGIRDAHLAVIAASPAVAATNLILRKKEWEKDFETRRSKAKNPDKIFPKKIEVFDSVEFNPGSPLQLQILLYEVLGLPVIDYTDTKQPATGAETLDKLINHCQEDAHKALLAALIGNAKAVKILSTFIVAFEASLDKGDGMWWLHGSFNIGGTVSGRLSSSDPNLQNIPAGSTYGKLIKSCFAGPKGWLFAGADFNSLEDYISALTTKDPNKLRVYEDSYDGHCLRAYYYFKDQMPDIRQAEPHERCFRVKSGNSILLCKSGDLIVLKDGSKIPVERYFETHC